VNRTKLYEYINDLTNTQPVPAAARSKT